MKQENGDSKLAKIALLVVLLLNTLLISPAKATLLNDQPFIGGTVVDNSNARDGFVISGTAGQGAPLVFFKDIATQTLTVRPSGENLLLNGRVLLTEGAQTNIQIDANASTNAITNIDVADFATNAGQTGQVIVFGAGGAPTAVGGTAGQVLTVGAGGIPAFAAAAGGGGAGTVTSVASADNSINVINGTTLVDLAVAAAQPNITSIGQAANTTTLLGNAIVNQAFTANGNALVRGNLTVGNRVIADNGGALQIDGLTITLMNANGAILLGPNTVNSAAIINGAIAAEDIGNDVITANQIAANAITASELAANSVENGNVIDGSLIGADIANATITTAKLSSVSTANTPNTLVLRDANGDFLAGRVTSSALQVGNRVITDNGGALQVDGLTITLMNANGAILLGPNTVNTAAIINGTIANEDIGDGVIATNKLASVSSANLPNTLVLRDGNGSFLAGTINGVNIVSLANGVALNTTAIGNNTAAINSNITTLGLNANGIALNGVAISNNTAAINSNITTLGLNANGIALNATNIAANLVRIGNNANGVLLNATNIASNLNRIGANSNGVLLNLARTGANANGVLLNAGNITNNTTAIGNNAAAIGNTANGVALNTANIAANLVRIGNNANGVLLNATNIASNLNRIGANSNGVALNLARTGANANGVLLNAGNITTNAAAIANTANGVALNAANIAANRAAIGNNANGIALSAATLANATSNNTPNTLVLRDANGSFLAGNVTTTALQVGNRVIADNGGALQVDGLTITLMNSNGAILIGPNTVNSAAIINGAIANEDIGDGVIATNKLASVSSANTPNTLVLRDANGSFLAQNISLANLLTALSVRIGTQTIADNGGALEIGGSQILTAGGGANGATLGNNTVNSTSIVDNSITNLDLAANSVDNGNVLDLSLIGADLANATITNDKLASISVLNTPNTIVLRDGNGSFLAQSISLADRLTSTVVQIANQSITSNGGVLEIDGAQIITAGASNGATLGNNTVNSTSIVDNSITNLDLAANSVDNGNVLDLSLIGADLANATITNNKLANASSNNVANSVVLRDANGSFLAQTISLADLLAGTSVQVGNQSITNNGGTLEIGGSPIVTGQAGAVGNNTVNSTSIVDNSITNLDLAANSVDNGNVLDLSLIGADLANATITNDKLANASANNVANSVVLRDANGSFLAQSITLGDRLTTNLVQIGNQTIINNGGTLEVGGAQILTAGNGTALAANTVNSTSIQNNTITNGDIMDGSITGRDIANNTITNGNILDGSITGRDIANNTITNGNILDGSITGRDIANNTITNGNILDNSITNDDLALNSVDNGNVLDLSLIGADIANNTITNDKLAQANTLAIPNTVALRDLNGNLSVVGLTANSVTATNNITSVLGSVTAPQVNATSGLRVINANISATGVGSSTLRTADLLLDNTLTITNNVIRSNGGRLEIDGLPISTVDLANGGVLTPNTVTSTTIQDNSITNGDIMDGSITGRDIANNTITNGNILDGSITGNDIANNTVTGNNIANNTITNGNIMDGSITGTDIANNTVTGNNIADGTITNGDIMDGSVTGDDIADNSITNNDLANDSVNSDKIQDNSVTSNDIQDNTIQNGDILDNSITNDDLALNSVDNGNILDGSIVGADIADGSIATTKLAAVDTAATANTLALRDAQGSSSFNNIDAQSITIQTNTNLGLGTGADSVIFGNGANAAGTNSIAIGTGASVTGAVASSSIAIGQNASTTHSEAVVIGPGAQSTLANQIVLGRTNTPPEVVVPGSLTVAGTISSGNGNQPISFNQQIAAQNGIQLNDTTPNNNDVTITNENGRVKINGTTVNTRFLGSSSVNITAAAPLQVVSIDPGPLNALAVTDLDIVNMLPVAHIDFENSQIVRGGQVVNANFALNNAFAIPDSNIRFRVDMATNQVTFFKFSTSGINAADQEVTVEINGI